MIIYNKPKTKVRYGRSNLVPKALTELAFSTSDHDPFDRATPIPNGRDLMYYKRLRCINTGSMTSYLATGCLQSRAPLLSWLS